MRIHRIGFSFLALVALLGALAALASGTGPNVVATGARETPVTIQPTTSNLAVPVIVTNFPNPQSVAGTVSVKNFPTVQSVNVANDSIQVRIIHPTLVRGHSGIPNDGTPTILSVPAGVVLTDAIFSGGNAGYCRMSIADNSGTYFAPGDAGQLHLQSGLPSDGSLVVSCSCTMYGGVLMWTGYQQ